MQQAKWIDEGIKLGNRFHYRKKTPWRHNALNLTVFGGLMGSIGVVIGAGGSCSPWLYLPIAAFVLGALFFALIVLVVHEASHEMFLIARDRERARRWNRICGWIVAVPFGINCRRHREEGHQSVPGLDKTRRLPSFAAAVGWPAPGAKLRRTVDLLSSPGIVYLCHLEREQIERDYQRIGELEGHGALVVLDQQPILYGGDLS